ncbi:ABC transporter substrate-binding protein [Aidingimonas lacisalsi]|uniref:ABC transporter substrate-binding protein n=1 Tax=Aidingimonas lacisalsi TaxID=2604086 RepID=UPI0011D19E2B|nr:ABC transporter substrate-binding protein [Aidingimonas lacisalsi]
MKRANAASLIMAGLSLVSPPLAADDTVHFPANMPDQAGTEPRELIIEGALDIPQFQPVLKAFHQHYPDIDLHYRNFTTLALHQRFLDHEGANADVVISSAMPWQYRLANDGYGRALNTPEAEAWPEWARWRNELFAVTFEPIVMVYHDALTERFEPISSHDDLLTLLENQREALQGRVVTYDPERSGAGYTYAIQEAQLSPRYWELVSAMGSVNTDLVGTTGEMLNGLADGDYLIGYNLLGSYARDFVRDHPQLNVVIPDDYALIVQRPVFVSRNAPNPQTGELFLNYLLSETGQRVLAERTSLGAVHPGLDGEGTARELRRRLGDALRPIRLGPGLLATLDDLKRDALLSRWQREYRRLQDTSP